MSLQVNRNIIGVLLSYSTKMGRAIDFERGLKVSLPALPLSALQMKMEVTEKKSKSKLMDVINPKENENSAQAPSENNSDSVIHFIALVQTLAVIVKT